MKNLRTLIILLLIAAGIGVTAQVTINTDNSAPDPSAMLDVKSTNRGLLIPRISTAARNLLPSPATGLLIYNTTTNGFDYYNGSFWHQLGTAFISSSSGNVNPGGGVAINVLPNILPDNSAMLDINDPTRGILTPRISTSARDLISSPATGLIIYNTTTNLLDYYNGNQWIALCSVSTGIPGADGSQASVGVAVNTDGSSPHPSAILDVTSVYKGVLIPRLTNAQRDAILPVTGLVIYNTSSNYIEFYNGSAWYLLITNLLVPPAGGTHVASPNQIIWNWNTVAGAAGYKWNTINDYATATDMATSTIKTETGLVCATAYTRYVWAYNDCGYSSALSLTKTTLACGTCGTSLVDARDGQTYNTVQIGTQCWMAENLNFGTMVPDTNNMTNNSIAEKYCYENNTANCDTYGGLYQWKEMMEYSTIPGVQGICPAGWHVPDNEEWTLLTTFLGGESIAGGEMKTMGTIEAGTGLWYDPNTAATNSSGFSALPGGYRQDGGGFTSLGNYGNFWTSTEAITEYVWFRNLLFQYAFVSSGYGVIEAYGYSVRCLKDSPPPVWSCGDPLLDTRDNQTYNTVQIDTQCWMAENLNIGTMIPGFNEMTNNSITEKYCYENNTTNCDTYGGLYQWNEMMEYSTTSGVQGICPTGWHVPADTEWTMLTTFLGGESIAGGEMKTTGTIEAGTGLWYAPNTSSTNSSSFSAFPGGNRYGNGSFYDKGLRTFFWSSTEDQLYFSWRRILNYDNTAVTHDYFYENNGYSVRCVKDTPPTWSCGQPLSVTHTAGDIAPVNKTVNYGTVETNLTGSNQCWITQNLGSDNQAVSATDATEASAGWYWQFNSKQGFNHDGTIRTPNTFWIYGTGETSEWLQANDPCSLLLGNGWRLPTHGEWNNADVNGGWTNHDQSYASVLKLHSAGYLDYNSGYLLSRGSIGLYWSSSHISSNYGWSFQIDNSGSDMYSNSKYYGFSSRCLSDSYPPAWSCGNPMTDIRDNQTYTTVQIGTQCWMAENLNIGTMIQGGNNMTNNSITEKYCYENNTANCDTYGGLYQWKEMMEYSTTHGVQGICPTGWHLPADEEWTILTAFLGGESIAGGEMKTTGTIEAGTGLWYDPNTGATNSSGLSALPGGMMIHDGSSSSMGNYANFWSSTEYYPDYAKYRLLYFSHAIVDNYGGYEGYGLSVRCVKGEYINLPPSQPVDPNPPDNSQNQSIFTQPSWTCTDPENDPLTYDVYFGTSNPLSLVSSGQTGTNCNPGILENSSLYYWKIVAHDNHSNTTEGPVWSFTTITDPFACGNPLLDARDNQTYNTVQIGTQCWMAENLNIGTMIPGSTEMADNGIVEKYCYSNSAANCDVYGGLYQWNEMMEYSTMPEVQGLCPAGWHLPSDAEWTDLTTFLGGESVAGGKMKSTGTIETGTGLWWNPNTGATNESGFTAIPGGFRFLDGTFLDRGFNSFFWSSTQYSATYTWHRQLNESTASVIRNWVSKGHGFSVRCLKGNIPSNFPPSQPGGPNPSDNTQNQPVNTVLSWTCTDPENDPLTYDIYFGTYGFPALVAFGQTGTSFNLGTLAYSTPYSWKIVAHDNHSNSTEGQVWSFTTMSVLSWQCGDPMTDVRDNQTYTTVQIGAKCWMAENLNIGTMIPGTTEMTNNSIPEKYCYNNSTGNCDIYGGIYQWNEVMQYSNTFGVQGLCPANWHLPTDPEWTALTTILGGESISGGKMKTTGTIEAGTGLWYTPNNGATNESGFSAFPGGYRGGNGVFYDMGYVAFFWSSSMVFTVYEPYYAWDRRMLNSYNDVSAVHENKSWGCSIRCVQGVYSNEPPTMPSAPIPSDNTQNQPVNTQLSWTCTDLENDPLTYDVYFGTYNFPALVSFAQTDTSYNPGTLAYSTSYSWKIVAHDNHSNTTEGPVWSFTTTSPPYPCGNPLLDTRDNQTYNTIQIGTQCWMAKNLNIGTMIPGANQMANNSIIEKYCYDNTTANCAGYGGLYQWNEMMQYTATPGAQGICPTGWHLPSHADWSDLINFLGEQSVAGGKMKETGTTHWTTPNTGATNSSGFTVLPGGSHYHDTGTFEYLGDLAYFWSSDESFGPDSYYLNLYYNSADVYLGWGGNKFDGLSVRCLAD